MTDPTSLGDAMRALVKKLDRGGKIGTVRVMEVWRETVGPDIEEHTWIQGLERGVLTIAVDSHVWATELTAMSGELTGRINTAIGEGSVREIRFTVSQAVARSRSESHRVVESERRYGGERVQPVPLTEAECAAIERSLGNIPEGPLRDAALRATIRDLEWKKGQEYASGAQNGADGPREAE